MSNPGSAPIRFIDNPHAPDVFADSVTEIFVWSGNVRLTFESVRVDHSTSPGPVNRVVIGRLVIPIAAAENLRDLLAEFLGKPPEQGVIPQAPGSPTIQ